MTASERSNSKIRDDLLGEAHYGRICAGLEHRLFARVAGAFKIASLLAGTSVIGGLIASNGFFQVLGAIVTGLVPILDFVWAPERKAEAALACKREFAVLLKGEPDLSDEELTKRLRAVQMDSCADYLEGLREVAYAQTIAELGRPGGPRSLTWWERILQAVA